LGIFFSKIFWIKIDFQEYQGLSIRWPQIWSPSTSSGPSFCFNKHLASFYWGQFPFPFNFQYAFIHCTKLLDVFVKFINLVSPIPIWVLFSRKSKGINCRRFEFFERFRIVTMILCLSLWPLRSLLKVRSFLLMSHFLFEFRAEKFIKFEMEQGILLPLNEERNLEEWAILGFLSSKHLQLHYVHWKTIETETLEKNFVQF